VEDQAAFEQMRAHLLSLYDGVHVNHSFESEGEAYDCIPIMEQPAVRLNGITEIATPPELAKVEGGNPDPNDGPKSALPFGGVETDSYGNHVGCEDGYIPMRRMTIEELTRFRTLANYMRKEPEDVDPGPVSDIGNTVAVTHKYSHATQSVNNWGGNGFLNIWKPAINTAASEGFSLTQHWYYGGSGTSLPGLQTVEVGWQVYPALYGNTNPHLFVYHTADGYNHTGCYNLSCSDFVSTSKAVVPGANVSPVSVAGGGQYEIQIQVQLYKGNWWIYYAGTAFGYYPTSLYHGGQLSHNASGVDYGTEVTGTTVWPTAGSGQWPNTGWTHAAYVRDLFYINSSLTGVWETLTPQIPSPHCYSVAGPYWGGYTSASPWGYYFYDGGPGGGGC
jgi:hypothetical protein